MKVIQTIQSTDPFDTGTVEPPKEVVYYQGDSLAQAITSAAAAIAGAEHDDAFFRVLAVRIDIAEVEV